MDRNINILVWNTRDLNDKSRRDTLRGVVTDARANVVCIQETRLNVISDHLIYECLGSEFQGFTYLPAIDTRGGILIACKSPDA